LKFIQILPPSLSSMATLEVNDYGSNVHKKKKSEVAET
jgi:hypothetical protein